jgi:hypothetical protein
MGKTTPTIAGLLHKERTELGRFRRALRKEDQLAFDELWVHVTKHMMGATRQTTCCRWRFSFSRCCWKNIKRYSGCKARSKGFDRPRYRNKGLNYSCGGDLQDDIDPPAVDQLRVSSPGAHK